MGSPAFDLDAELEKRPRSIGPVFDLDAELVRTKPITELTPEEAQARMEAVLRPEGGPKPPATPYIAPDAPLGEAAAHLGTVASLVLPGYGAIRTPGIIRAAIQGAKIAAGAGAAADVASGIGRGTSPLDVGREVVTRTPGRALMGAALGPVAKVVEGVPAVRLAMERSPLLRLIIETVTGKGAKATAPAATEAAAAARVAAEALEARAQALAADMVKGGTFKGMTIEQALPAARTIAAREAGATAVPGALPAGGAPPSAALPRVVREAPVTPPAPAAPAGAEPAVGSEAWRARAFARPRGPTDTEWARMGGTKAKRAWLEAGGHVPLEPRDPTGWVPQGTTPAAGAASTVAEAAPVVSRAPAAIPEAAVLQRLKALDQVAANRPRLVAEIERRFGKARVKEILKLIRGSTSRPGAPQGGVS